MDPGFYFDKALSWLYNQGIDLVLDVFEVINSLFGMN